MSQCPVNVLVTQPLATVMSRTHISVNAIRDAANASPAIFGQLGTKFLISPNVWQNCHKIAHRTDAYGTTSVCGTSKAARESIWSELVGWLEFNVPFQYKYGFIRDDLKWVIVWCSLIVEVTYWTYVFCMSYDVIHYALFRPCLHVGINAWYLSVKYFLLGLLVFPSVQQPLTPLQTHDRPPDHS